MSDDDKKPLGLRGGGTQTSRVRQSFSHGRTKSVVVEKKRKRVIVPKSGAAAGGAGGKPGVGGVNAPGISDAEMERRKRALMAAAAQENERAKKEAEESARREAEREARRREKEEKEREEQERADRIKAKEDLLCARIPDSQEINVVILGHNIVGLQRFEIHQLYIHPGLLGVGVRERFHDTEGHDLQFVVQDSTIFIGIIPPVHIGRKLRSTDLAKSRPTGVDGHVPLH